MARYPPTLAALTDATPDARADHKGEVLRFLRRVPRDPFAEPGQPAELGWGLRSFDSEADRPRAGAEVYDVYSRSERVGLNGVPLQAW